MKLAIFSPLNPQKSGISDYTEELLPYLLDAGAEIDLFVDGFRPQNRSLLRRSGCFDYRSDPKVLRRLADYDATLYHIGNNHYFHIGIYETARAHPGIVVFHDFALPDFFLGMAFEKNNPDIYLDEVEACDGLQARRVAAEALARGVAPPYASSSPDAGLAIEHPLNRRIANRAEGIIVHSQGNAERFRQIAPGAPVKRINLPIIPRHTADAFHSQHTTNAATESDTVQLACFGDVTPDKGIEHILRALASIRRTHDFRFTIVGQPNPYFNARELVRAYDLASRVHVTDHVSMQEFERRIAETDIAINLRARTMGETSASLCRIMAAGVPAIVSNVGWFAELPAGAVIKVDADEYMDEMLAAYLARLISDRELRTTIGANARRYMLAEHAIEKSARGYLEFIEEVIANRARHRFIGSVCAEISRLDLGGAEDFLIDVATRIAELTLAATASSDKDGAPHNADGTGVDNSGEAHSQNASPNTKV